jgi:hypothetical protein
VRPSAAFRASAECGPEWAGCEGLGVVVAVCPGRRRYPLPPPGVRWFRTVCLAVPRAGCIWPAWLCRIWIVPSGGKSDNSF